MSSSIQTRGERTRQTILDAAEQLFLAQGYNGTSIRQIAERAGDIAISGIYNHFTNKEDIFRALLKDRSPYPEVIAILDSIQGHTGPEMLRQAFMGIHDQITKHLNFVQLVVIDLQEFEGTTITSLASEVLPHALKFFARVQAAGGIRKDINTFVLIRAFIGTTAGFVMTGLILDHGMAARIPFFPSASNASWQDSIFDILMNGLYDPDQHR
jgi:AcrR family transcriptional regulator